MSRSALDPRRGARPDAGFLLLEFTVAFALACVLLAAFLTAQAIALRGDRHAAFLVPATLFAKSRLAEAGIAWPLEPGVRTGATPEGHAWRIEIAPQGDVDLGEGARAAAFRVVVTVTDPAAPRRPPLRLETIEIELRAGR